MGLYVRTEQIVQTTITDNGMQLTMITAPVIYSLWRQISAYHDKEVTDNSINC